MMSSIRRALASQLSLHQVIGLVVRVLLVLYGDLQDRSSSVPYTDVDYHVLTDAARHVSEGGSPFGRPTYRYTPYLAWLMLPNVWLHISCGKLLFCLLDCLAAGVIHRTLLLQGHTVQSAVKCSLMWLYNPIVIGISTRGSAESVVVTIVLLVIYLRQLSKPVLMGVALGFAIHLKMYPVIYCLPLYLSLEEPCGKYFWHSFYITRSRFKLSLSTAMSFTILTGIGYLLYGDQYIQEGFLYHVTRVDTRHNFSIYFYLLYLSQDYNIPGLGIVMFAPQMILVFAYGIVYGTKEHLVVSMFAQTVVFVSLNKVITSQYFVWYLVFVPLLCCRLQLSRCKSLLLPTLWLFAQAAWLLPAYLFEFRGTNVFVPIWLESIAFFCCNVGILMAVLSSYWLN